MKILKWTKRIAIGFLFVGWGFNVLNTFFPSKISSLGMTFSYMISVYALMTDIIIRGKNGSTKRK